MLHLRARLSQPPLSARTHHGGAREAKAVQVSLRVRNDHELHRQPEQTREEQARSDIRQGVIMDCIMDFQAGNRRVRKGVCDPG